MSVNSEPASDPSPSQVKILSLNIFLRPPFITNRGNDYKDLRLSYLINHILPKYQVVCLQEAFSFGSSRINTLIEQAKKIGYNYSINIQRPKYKLGIDGGLLVLSKYAITNNSQLIYNQGSGVDNLSYKGVLYVKLKISENVHINLFNTHLQASYKDSPDIDTDPGVLARFKQVEQLLTFVKSKIDNESPNLLVGDFNINGKKNKTKEEEAHSAEYNKLMKLVEETKLTVKDVMFEKYKHHKITFGDYLVHKDKLVPRETVLTNQSEYLSAQALDYVFLVGDSNWNNTGSIDAGVEECFINNDQFKPLTQVSDHYGIEISVTIRSSK